RNQRAKTERGDRTGFVVEGYLRVAKVIRSYHLWYPPPLTGWTSAYDCPGSCPVRERLGAEQPALATLRAQRRLGPARVSSAQTNTAFRASMCFSTSFGECPSR